MDPDQARHDEDGGTRHRGRRPAGAKLTGEVADNLSAPAKPRRAMTTRKKPRGKGRRGAGRPRGTIKLTAERRMLLIAAVEAGSTDHACARAAGVDPRTYRTYRAIAEGRHATRSPTPELLELFRDIDEAEARSRIKREIDVANRDPKTWLHYRARSRPGLDGWTEPVPEEGAEDGPVVYSPTPEEFEETLRVLVQATGLSPRRCGDPSCTCPVHPEADRDQT